MPIEDAIKADPVLVEVISHAMVVGDQKKHLSVILTLKSLLDANNQVLYLVFPTSPCQPLEELTPEVVSWLRSLGSSASTTSQLMVEDNPGVHPMVQVGERQECQLSMLQAAILEAVNRANKASVSQASKVHKFMLAPVSGVGVTGILFT